MGGGACREIRIDLHLQYSAVQRLLIVSTCKEHAGYTNIYLSVCLSTCRHQLIVSLFITSYLNIFMIRVPSSDGAVPLTRHALIKRPETSSQPSSPNRQCAVQSQTAVTAYFSSEKLLLFDFAQTISTRGHNDN